MTAPAELLGKLRGMPTNNSPRTTTQPPGAAAPHHADTTIERYLARRRAGACAPPPHERPAGRDPTSQPEWDGHVPQRLFAAFATQPKLAAPFLALCGALMELLAPRLRELVALRVSAVLDCEYSWTGHVQVSLFEDARAPAALTKADIAAVAGAGAAAFGGADTDILIGVDEILRDGALSETSLTALAKDAVSVQIAVGTYRTIAGLMHRVAHEPGLPLVAGLQSPTAARATDAGARRKAV